MLRTRVPVIYATVLAYLAAGRSVVPIAPGCKAPSVVDARTGRSVLMPWARYQEAHATHAEVQRWFAGPQPMGIGIVAGPVSGVTLPHGRRAGLKFLAFDDADVHTASWRCWLLEACFSCWRPCPARRPLRVDASMAIFASSGSRARAWLGAIRSR